MMGSDITNEAGEDLRLCVSLPTSSTHICTCSCTWGCNDYTCTSLIESSR